MIGSPDRAVNDVDASATSLCDVISILTVLGNDLPEVDLRGRPRRLTFDRLLGVLGMLTMLGRYEGGQPFGTLE